jgi:hypothetical protein
MFMWLKIKPITSFSPGYARGLASQSRCHSDHPDLDLILFGDSHILVVTPSRATPLLLRPCDQLTLSPAAAAATVWTWR